jgi:hypothetical protein
MLATIRRKKMRRVCMGNEDSIVASGNSAREVPSLRDSRAPTDFPGTAVPGFQIPPLRG